MIATAYIFLIAVSILLLLISFLLVFSINLDSIFSMSNIRESEIRTTLLVSVFFTIANFILLLYKQLFFAVNLSGFAAVTTILYQILVIVFLLVAKYFIEPSLLIVAIIYGVSNLFVGVFFTLYFFKRNDVLKFSFSNYKRNHIKSIGGVGIKFFIIQMCMLMIFTCDNIIISKYLGPEYVTSYSLILKTYQAFIMISYIILTPYWTLFAEAYYQKNTEWILKQYKKLYTLFLLMIIAVIAYSLYIQPLLKIWLHTELKFNKYMIYGFCIFVIIRVFIDLHAVFLNGIGKINVQLVLYLFAAIINIPLAIILIKHFNMGSEAVIFSASIAIAPMAIILPLQSLVLFRNIAK